jgi:hypothetical protein
MACAPPVELKRNFQRDVLEIDAEEFKMTTPSNSSSSTAINDMNITEIVERICKLNSSLENFWSRSDGWAPQKTAELLGAVRLDWQTSLSNCLHQWVTPENPPISDGQLILAWANLGSLIEGSIKLLLSVYATDYLNDPKGAKSAGIHVRNELPKSPAILTLEHLKIYCRKNKLLGEDGDALVELVQARRNAIHAFKHSDIGNLDEYLMAVRHYLELLRGINNRLPYPHDAWVPHEI